MSKKRFPKAIFAYVEHELYQNKYKLGIIKERRSDILEASSYDLRRERMRGRAYLSDSTVQKALELVEDKKISICSEWVECVERVLGRLSDKHKKLFDLRYNRMKTWREIERLMGVGREETARLQCELVMAVAIEMGLVYE